MNTFLVVIKSKRAIIFKKKIETEDGAEETLDKIKKKYRIRLYPTDSGFMGNGIKRADGEITFVSISLFNLTE